MKKILLLACACLVASTSAVAQIIDSEVTTTQTFYVEPEPKKEVGYPRYQGELNVGYETPMAIFLETIHGVRANKYFFVGAGIGAHVLTDDIDLEKGDNYIDYEGGFIPLFINLKGYYPVSDKFAPYINLSLGCDFAIDEESPGFYCDFGLGFKYRKFNFGLGLYHHGLNTHYYYALYDGYYDYRSDKVHFGYDSFYLKIGLCW